MEKEQILNEITETLINNTKNESEGWLSLSSLRETIEAKGIDFTESGKFLTLRDYLTSEFIEALDIQFGLVRLKQGVREKYKPIEAELQNRNSESEEASPSENNSETTAEETATVEAEPQNRNSESETKEKTSPKSDRKLTREECKSIVKHILEELTTEEKPEIPITNIGQELRRKGVTKGKEYSRLIEFLHEFSQIMEIRKDESGRLPQYFAKLKVQEEEDKIEESKMQKQDDRVSDSSTKDSSSTQKYKGIARGKVAYAAIGSVFIPPHMFEELKELAVEETWYFKNDSPDSCDILRNYLTYTIQRLGYEKKILKQQADGKPPLCALNTGLIDNNGEFIYGLLETSRGHHKWYLKSLFTSGIPSDGRTKYNQNFSSFPERANYFIDPSLIVCEANNTNLSNREHIKSNFDRLPDSFFDAHGISKEGPQTTIGSLVESDLEKTLNKVKINYRTAVPIYYPKMQRVSLALPLYLPESNEVYASVILSKAENNTHCIETLYSLDYTYLAARLIAQTEHSWLCVDEIESTRSSEKRTIINWK